MECDGSNRHFSRQVRLWEAPAREVMPEKPSNVTDVAASIPALQLEGALCASFVSGEIL
jgi:hypothetical protein